jgi:hypothetical protein
VTRATALELIRRMDINRELVAGGRPLTNTDSHATEELWDRATVEDILLGDAPLSRAQEKR